MSVESRGQLSTTIWLASVGVTFLVLLSQVVNAVGLHGEPGSAPLYLGLVWLILVASLMYARMLFGMRHSPDA